jgi:quercetin dioxygenase-like cupin family protein
MTMSVETISRRPLLTANIGGRNVTSVDVREIRFKPKQETGLHKHPCPVIGYIAEGRAIFQIEGQPERELLTGAAFFEPANTVIRRFDNASPTEDMMFIACYLLDGEQELIEMLRPEEQEPER